MTNLVITGLFHDTSRKRSLVTVKWENDPEKHLGLVVPFGCGPRRMMSPLIQIS
jgi:hypothetical protein